MVVFPYTKKLWHIPAEKNKIEINDAVYFCEMKICCAV